MLFIYFLLDKHTSCMYSRLKNLEIYFEPPLILRKCIMVHTDSIIVSLSGSSATRVANLININRRKNQLTEKVRRPNYEK